ncbi:MAG: radical SAM protein [Deltaproteobacteria bacterium]|jgi:MoaA/NifB/PqqE/SkfB family radical SAM enzyme|nr:radical SAM protein [Deltaproteobacteria bacterium]MBW2533156.1 radical SAM protein [Deltaproteobacteria bacterium]
MPGCVEVAPKARHWVRLATACNNRCIFCLDGDTPRDVVFSAEEIEREIDRGRAELGARRLILSGGEPTVHPAFVELVRYGRAQGYERIQTVTNGHRFADRSFFEACMDAGLGEITFSVHGHTAELHDRLTGKPGAFRALMKGLVRAVRDGRAIVNVDVVINKQNVAHLPDIVELCVGLGVTEFDLLQLIPQGRAHEHREDLFYDVGEHLPTLQKVFRLNRHPRLVIWTNRFPIAYLEGLEDLIQDPYKLLDEVAGRRYQIRRYLDVGEPLDCRDPERCPHCFVEPFCTTMDRVVAWQNRKAWEVWWVGEEGWDGSELPFGCQLLGVELAELSDAAEIPLPAGAGLMIEVGKIEPLTAGMAKGAPVVVVARDEDALEQWLGGELPPEVEVDVVLSRRTSSWLLAHRARLAHHLERATIRQPAHPDLESCRALDLSDPAELFRQLGLPLRVSGLPPCLAPGTELVAERRVLDRRLFDPATGRLDLAQLARHHVAERYRAKSVRCATCPVAERCEGAHVQMIRHLGLASLRPLAAGPDADAARHQLEQPALQPPSRLAAGRPPEPVAPSLPGFPDPEPPPLDPLAIIELERMRRRQNGHGDDPAED